MNHVRTAASCLAFIQHGFFALCILGCTYIGGRFVLSILILY